MKKLNRILLIDDDHATNFLHRLILQEMNLSKRIDVALNGKEALTLLESCKTEELPNLVFLDINMPLMNGFQFLENYSKLKKEKKEKIILIMLSSSVNEREIAKSKEYNDICTFIGKPLTEENIISIWNDYFDS